MSVEFWYRRTTVIALWGLMISAVIYLFSFEPGKTGFFPSCPFRFLTGLQCPGCGITRALHNLLHGHLMTAFTLNPLFVVALPFLIFVLLRYTSYAFQQKTPRANALPANVIYFIFVVVASFWIFRNTPFYPFVS